MKNLVFNAICRINIINISSLMKYLLGYVLDGKSSEFLSKFHISFHFKTSSQFLSLSLSLSLSQFLSFFFFSHLFLFLSWNRRRRIIYFTMKHVLMDHTRDHMLLAGTWSHKPDFIVK